MFRALVTAVKNKQTKKTQKTKTYEKPLPSCLLGKIYNRKTNKTMSDGAKFDKKQSNRRARKWALFKIW